MMVGNHMTHIVSESSEDFVLKPGLNLEILYKEKSCDFESDFEAVRKDKSNL